MYAAPEIGRRLHSREHHADAPCPGARDDLGQVLFQARDWQTSQAVVGAQLDDENLHVAGKRPVEAAQTTRGCVTRNARVDDLVRIPRFPQTCLDERRHGLFLREPIARRQAVAQEHDSRSRSWTLGASARRRCGVPSRASVGTHVRLRARRADERERERSIAGADSP